jgi:hypothetical protein
MTRDPVASFGPDLVRADTATALSTVSPDLGSEGEAPLAAGFTAIGPFGSDRALREAALVLTSKTIAHGVARGVGGGVLLVRDGDYARARTQLDRYEEENRNFPPQRFVERSRYRSVSFVIAMFALFVAFAWLTGPVSKPHGVWFQEGASVSTLVLSSEPFRAVTALTLHADGAHVLSNLVSGATRARARRLARGGGFRSSPPAPSAASATRRSTLRSARCTDRSAHRRPSSLLSARRHHAAVPRLATRRPASKAPHHGVLLSLSSGAWRCSARSAPAPRRTSAHAFGLLAGFVTASLRARRATASRSTSSSASASRPSRSSARAGR